MADKKITELTAATVPLAGTEVVPIIQGAETRRVTVANLTAGRAVTMTDLNVIGSSNLGDSASADVHSINGRTSLVANSASPALSVTQSGAGLGLALTGPMSFTGGNIVQGTAAAGVNFTANTPAAGMTSRLLNWYEEGTWTPTVSGLVLTIALGTYTKIGNKVFANFQVASSALVSAINFELGGLPFVPKSSTAPDRSAGYLTYNADSVNWTLLFAASTSLVQFRLNPVGTIGTITDLSGNLLWGTLVYTATT